MIEHVRGAVGEVRRHDLIQLKQEGDKCELK